MILFCVQLEQDRSLTAFSVLKAVIKMEDGDEIDLDVLEPAPVVPKIKEEKHDETSTLNEKGEKNGKAKKKRGKKRKENDESGSESGAYSDSASSGDEAIDVEVNDATPDDALKRVPRQLHRTTSIFLRNLPPSTTKGELEALFKAHKGFKRIALSDPAPERGFFRRGWATFDANVNIKDICWSLNNVKIKDFNPGAIINRDLNKRVRPTPTHLCHHKSIVRNDIKLATKIIQNLDKRWRLWNNSADEKIEVKKEIVLDDQEKDKEVRDFVL
jgi:hypothetical protein